MSRAVAHGDEAGELLGLIDMIVQLGHPVQDVPAAEFRGIDIPGPLCGSGMGVAHRTEGHARALDTQSSQQSVRRSRHLVNVDLAHHTHERLAAGRGQNALMGLPPLWQCCYGLGPEWGNPGNQRLGSAPAQGQHPVDLAEILPAHLGNVLGVHPGVEPQQQEQPLSAAGVAPHAGQIILREEAAIGVDGALVAPIALSRLVEVWPVLSRDLRPEEHGADGLDIVAARGGGQDSPLPGDGREVRFGDLRDLPARADPSNEVGNREVVIVPGPLLHMPLRDPAGVDGLVGGGELVQLGVAAAGLGGSLGDAQGAGMQVGDQLFAGVLFTAAPRPEVTELALDLLAPVPVGMLRERQRGFSLTVVHLGCILPNCLADSTAIRYSNHRYSRLRDSDPEPPVYKHCIALRMWRFAEDSEGFQSTKDNSNPLMVVQKLYMDQSKTSVGFQRLVLRNSDGTFAPHTPAYRVAEVLRKVARMRETGARV